VIGAGVVVCIIDKTISVSITYCGTVTTDSLAMG